MIVGCLGILALSATLTACSDDDNDSPVTPPDSSVSYVWSTDGGFKSCDHVLFDAEGKAYCVTEVNAYFTDPTKADAEAVAAPVNPTVYIGVKGDANLDGIVDTKDAVSILTYYAKVAAGHENVAFNEDENLSKLAFFLADVDTESKAGVNSGSQLMATQDAVSVLTYYAKSAAGQAPTWPDVIPSLKSLEGSIWFEG